MLGRVEVEYLDRDTYGRGGDAWRISEGGGTPMGVKSKYTTKSKAVSAAKSMMKDRSQGGTLIVRKKNGNVDYKKKYESQSSIDESVEDILGL